MKCYKIYLNYQISYENRICLLLSMPITIATWTWKSRLICLKFKLKEDTLVKWMTIFIFSTRDFARKYIKYSSLCATYRKYFFLVLLFTVIITWWWASKFISSKCRLKKNIILRLMSLLLSHCCNFMRKYMQ